MDSGHRDVVCSSTEFVGEHSARLFRYYRSPRIEIEIELALLIFLQLWKEYFFFYIFAALGQKNILCISRIKSVEGKVIVRDIVTKSNKFLSYETITRV